MSTLTDKLKALAAFEERGKELVTEFRYACYPDADKDQLETLLADYACHGFESGLGVRFDRLAPLLEAYNACVEALENISVLEPYPSTDVNIRRSHGQHIQIASTALARLQALADEGA